MHSWQTPWKLLLLHHRTRRWDHHHHRQGRAKGTRKVSTGSSIPVCVTRKNSEHNAHSTLLLLRCMTEWLVHAQTNKQKKKWMNDDTGIWTGNPLFFSRKVGSVLLVLREKHWDPTKMHDPGMLPGDIVCVGSSAFWKSTARLYLREFLSFLSSFRDERTLKCAARDESLNYTREGKQGRPGKASLVLLSFFSGFRGSSAGGQEEARGSRCRVRQRRSLIVDHVQVRLQRQTVHAGAKCVYRCGKRGAS